MAAKLVILLAVLAIVLCVAVVATYLYLRDTAKMEHEKEMARMEKRNELDEQLVEMADSESGIDAELEREQKR